MGIILVLLIVLVIDPKHSRKNDNDYENEKD